MLCLTRPNIYVLPHALRPNTLCFVSIYGHPVLQRCMENIKKWEPCNKHTYTISLVELFVQFKEIWNKKDSIRMDAKTFSSLYIMLLWPTLHQQEIASSLLGKFIWFYFLILFNVFLIFLYIVIQISLKTYIFILFYVLKSKFSSNIIVPVTYY